MTNALDKPTRKPGAPLGNTNALKHGFYSRQLKPTDLLDLEESSFDGLNSEIALLRVLIRRVVEQGMDLNSFADSRDLLRVACLASTTITRLVRTQHLMFSPQSELEAAIEQALSEVTAELGISRKD